MILTFLEYLDADNNKNKKCFSYFDGLEIIFAQPHRPS